MPAPGYGVPGLSLPQTPEEKLYDLLKNFQAQQGYLNAQGSVTGAKIGLASQQQQASFGLPMQLISLQTQLAQNRNRINQNFGPNRARRAFIGGI